MGIVTTVRLVVRVFSWLGPKAEATVEKIQAKLDARHYNTREAARCFKLRRYADAVAFYAAALKEAESRHYSVDKKMDILLHLSECLRRSGDAASAEQVAQQALSMAKDETQMLNALDEMGCVKEAVGDKSAALEMARRAYQTSKKGKHSIVQLAERCGRLAELERAVGDKNAGNALLREAIAYYEESHGSHHPKTATQLTALAQVLQAEGKYGEAMPLLEQALAVHQGQLGATAPETLADLERIGQIHYLQGHLDQAIEIYSKLVRLKENVLGLGHVQQASFLIDVATVHQAAGQTGRAIEYLYNARQKAGRDATLGPLIEERLAHLAEQH